MTKDEALRMALEAMQMYAESERKVLRICDEAITAIKEALAQPEPKPLKEHEIAQILDRERMKWNKSPPYKRHWSIDSCKEYVKQLRDKTRANTAEHAAQAIEFLLTECDALHKEIDGNHAMMERQTARIVELQEHIENFDGEDR